MGGDVALRVYVGADSQRRPAMKSPGYYTAPAQAGLTAPSGDVSPGEVGCTEYALALDKPAYFAGCFARWGGADALTHG